MQRSPIPGFLYRFVVIYFLLIMPWPGWDELYGEYFRALGQMAFTRTEGKRIVLFEFHPVQHGFSTLNTRMTLSNRDLLDNGGNGLAEMVDLDTRSIGWVPTALTAALILATPISWRRRGFALLPGLCLIHGFILFTLQAWIWNQSPKLSLNTATRFWSEFTEGLQYTLITQLGVSFTVPVLIWILVTFRRQDEIIGKK